MKTDEKLFLLKERKAQVAVASEKEPFAIDCEKKSTAGAVSQRACVFCGSRVVLYPIADALHIVHGPIGCAVYTWDIRGSLSSGPQLHRESFSSDLREKEIVFGGEKKLYAGLKELIQIHKPKAAFVYATCVTGLIGDDIDAVCKKVALEEGIPVLPVHSEGFKGTKKDGYSAACDALFKIIGTDTHTQVPRISINILGEFNIAGEAWIIREYYKRMGIHVVSVMTGDGRIDEIRNAHKASLNLVQCSGSMTSLAKRLEKEYGIPYKRVSYFGMEDTAAALYEAAHFFSDEPQILKNTKALVKEEMARILPAILEYKKILAGKKAAIYVGGGFKAVSLIRALRNLEMEITLVGSQTGSKEDYEFMRDAANEGAIIVDDTNPVELSRFVKETKTDLLIGGVKERPIAYKLGIGFCDHNHERKIALAGFEGMKNFADEVACSVLSPVWKYAGTSV